PRRLAERLVPRRGRGHPVANVQVHALEQRQIAHRLAHGPRRARGLRPLTFAFDGLPGTAAAVGPRPPPPDPVASVFHPAFANQRLGQAVVVLREIVAEPTLDARRALIGRVQLDVRGRDAGHRLVRHVEIHLAPYAAVRADRADRPLRVADLFGREPLARHHLEDGARRTHPDALAAPGAARF